MSRKNSFFYRESLPEDFSQHNTEPTDLMYDSGASSDEHCEYDKNSMETEELFQQNRSSINMKYIPKTTIKYVNVLLIKQPENEKELIPNLRVEVVKNKGVSLCSLMDVLKTLGFPLYKTMVFFLDVATNSFVYAGNDPITQETYIPLNPRKNEISIKYRKPQNLDDADKGVQEEKKMERGMDRREREEREREREVDLREREMGGCKKRIKERYIREVIEKVNLWRLYHKEGFYDRTQNRLISLSLDAAAQKVGISKKTLDDYLFQLRAGEKYGFNFTANCDKKIGVLRSFVRKHRVGDKEIKIRQSKKIYQEDKTTPSALPEPINNSYMMQPDETTPSNGMMNENPSDLFNYEQNAEDFLSINKRDSVIYLNAVNEENCFNREIIREDEEINEFGMDLEENLDQFLNHDRDN